MTAEEAINWLKLQQNEWQSEDNPQDTVDEILFVQKQFFLSKVPLERIYQPKIRLLKQLDVVQNALGLNGAEELQHFAFVPQQSIAATYREYQETRNFIKQKLLNSAQALSVIHYAEQLLRIQKEYAALWNKPEADLSAVLVSQEPDPMLLLAAIRDYEQSGGTSFLQLSKGENNVPEVLLNEQKRLSLLFQKY